MAYKYELKAEMQRKTFDHLLEGARRLIEDVKTDIFCGLKDLIDQSKRN